MESSGTKHDQGKPQMDLISGIFLYGLADVLTFGARKYAAHNWRKGIAYSRLFGALMRHLWAWWGGEELDPESGRCHLDHAACCLMFLRELSQTRKDLDDRYKQKFNASAGYAQTSENTSQLIGRTSTTEALPEGAPLSDVEHLSRLQGRVQVSEVSSQLRAGVQEKETRNS